ncbi:TetR family transcriptional regulator [Actinomadura sp. LD22]|uniref:TetR family transcriptional regulator n=2 Tax=Actinomadura physcomitrii TaxID=2650748 RepID=A0A6I4M9Y4_9ACTN|nr:TetR family transcriptional regulator [Actinomadura physcomitrii]MWA03048.1 TetR family transcriptional regulator [Actinomadura physcomitrii]
MTGIRDEQTAGTDRRRPGRPRDPVAEQRILDAAIDEFLERGPARFTIDGVARRAGVGKSTVYLRWPDRDALLVESVRARSRSIEDVDTGSLRGDLIRLTTNLLRFLRDPLGYATFRITVDAVANPAYEHIARELAQKHRHAARRVFDRARTRGDTIDEAAVDPVVECLYGAVTMQVLNHGLDMASASEVDLEAHCTSTVDLVLRLLEP